MRVRPRRLLLGPRLLVSAALVALLACVSVVSSGPAAALPAGSGPGGPALDGAAAMALLDSRAATGLPADVADFGLDEQSGRVVVNLVGDTPPGARPGLTGLLAGIAPELLDLRTGAGAPHHQAALRGGDTIIGGSLRCTVGFVTSGSGRDWLLTAGHCTRNSGTWYAGGVPVGSGARTAGSGTDVGAVPVTEPGWQPQPAVGPVPVRGATAAAVGDPVCLVGSTSGRVCGTITGRNRTVNFDGTMQRGMTSTSICSHEGDSGGPYVTSAGQAQGVHSGGGTGSACVSYFTPVSTALSALGLRLRTR